MNNKFSWYVLNVYAGSERRVVQLIREAVTLYGLEDCVEDILIPSVRVAEVRRGKKVETEKKIFPGYVLLHVVLTDQLWNTIKSIPRVTGFLGGAQRPVPISKAEARKILDYLEGAESETLEVDYLYEPGDPIKVIDGPFSSFQGVVEEVSLEKKKVSVSVFIFGRSTPLELDFNQIEKTS